MCSTDVDDLHKIVWVGNDMVRAVSYRHFYATALVSMLLHRPTLIKLLKLPLCERALFAPSCGFTVLDELLD